MNERACLSLSETDCRDGVTPHFLIEKAQMRGVGCVWLVVFDNSVNTSLFLSMSAISPAL